MADAGLLAESCSFPRAFRSVGGARSTQIVTQPHPSFPLPGGEGQGEGGPSSHFSPPILLPHTANVGIHRTLTHGARGDCTSVGEPLLSASIDMNTPRIFHLLSHRRASGPARMAVRVGLAALLAAGPAQACDLCSVYNVPLAHGNLDQGFHVGFAEQFSHFGSIQEESRHVRNEAHQAMDSSVSQFLVGYQINDRFGVQFTMPYLHRSFRRAENGGIDNGEESGLGDVALSLNCIAYRHESERNTFLWRISGGLKFPTGDTRRIAEELDETVPPPGAPESAIHGHDLTLGSGSYDLFVGTEILLRRDRLYFTAGAAYSIRTRGDYHYKFANDLTWQGGPGYYLLFEQDLTLGLQAEVSGEWKKKDELGHQPAQDTALTAIYFGPRLNLSWHSHLSADVAFLLPMDIQNSAVQSVVDWRMQGGLIWRF